MSDLPRYICPESCDAVMMSSIWRIAYGAFPVLTTQHGTRNTRHAPLFRWMQDQPLRYSVAGTAPQADEGAAAHIWQLLMILELPLVAVFAIRWLPEAPRQAVLVLGLQLLAIGGALAPVALLRW